jgi:hypothetical protein
MTKLEHYFAQIPDSRRPAGRRYALSKLLLALTLGVMSGYQGCRELARFMRHNQEELIEHIEWERKNTPSHELIRTLLFTIDFDKVNQAFMSWVRENTDISSGDWLAIDGKALKSTLTEYHQEAQNFINMVSAFSHRIGCVIEQQPMENKITSEIQTVRSLIEKLQGEGFMLTLDAIHAQKNS